MARKALSFEEFQKRFPDEAACAAFIFKKRWPKGFVCPACGCMRPVTLKSRAYTYECLDCGRQTSITAGTVMHRTKLPLTAWFRAAHLMSNHSNGMSALQLKAQMGVNYKTAWLLEQKLRRSMVDPRRSKLTGIVEVDQTEIPFRTKASFFDEALAKKIIIVGAVEVVDAETGITPRIKRKGALYHNTKAGRVRLAVIPDNSAESIEAFVRANIEPGSNLITDGHRSYLGLHEYRHDPHVVKNIAAHIPMQWIHRVFSLMKRWGLGTYHGLRLKHIDTYLNEYVFRFNRRQHRKVSFETLLGLASKAKPVSYWEITGDENPRKRKRPERKNPRQRKTAFGMRQDQQPKRAPRRKSRRSSAIQ